MYQKTTICAQNVCLQQIVESQEKQQKLPKISGRKSKTRLKCMLISVSFLSCLIFAQSLFPQHHRHQLPSPFHPIYPFLDTKHLHLNCMLFLEWFLIFNQFTFFSLLLLQRSNITWFGLCCVNLIALFLNVFFWVNTKKNRNEIDSHS